jgi:ubiquitin-conjugating enzyme E2 C
MQGRVLTKRIQREINKGIESNLFKFKYDEEGVYGPAGCAYIEFKPDGLYKDQTHILRIEFTYDSKSYPQYPPRIKFMTPMFHVNVNESGAICLDVLQKAWSPMYDIETIYNSIIALLACPNTSSALNMEAGELYDAGELVFVEFAANYYNDRIKNINDNILKMFQS